MNAQTQDTRTPKMPLVAIAVLVACVTAFVGIARLTGIGVADVSDEPFVERMQVRFLDEADGGVGAYEPETDAVLHVFQPGEGGFVRTALRSLGLNRRKLGIGPQPPYELHKSATGHVVLFDPTTQKSITLDAFGDANEADFAQLFDLPTERDVP
ncbi:MAG: photosynthetic complex assembly protein PuhC [Pseudomonadota bacterium]